jgi:hypothetical protein
MPGNMAAVTGPEANAAGPAKLPSLAAFAAGPGFHFPSQERTHIVM